MSLTSLTLSDPTYHVSVEIDHSLAAPVFGLQVGTGGAVTLEYLRTRGSRGYQFPAVNPDRVVRTPLPATVSPAKILAHIRTVLRANVIDLAKALRVSRQAIYDWQANRSMAADNIDRLQDIGRAADLIAREGLETTAYLLRRPIAAGAISSRLSEMAVPLSEQHEC
jgi:hypothetical protein